MTILSYDDVTRILEISDLPKQSRDDIKFLIENQGGSKVKTQLDVDYAVDCAMDEHRGQMGRVVDLFQCTINRILENTDFKTQKNQKRVEKMTRQIIEEIEMIIDDGININYKY